MNHTLTDEQAHILREAVYYAVDFAEVIRYSGRSMYGKECVAITSEDSARMLIKVMQYLMGDADSAAQRVADLLADHSVRTDSMGRGSVVYWPSLSLPEGFVENDDDDDDE